MVDYNVYACTCRACKIWQLNDFMGIFSGIFQNDKTTKLLNLKKIPTCNILFYISDNNLRSTWGYTHNHMHYPNGSFNGATNFYYHCGQSTKL